MGDSITAQIGLGEDYYRFGLWSDLASRLGGQIDIVYNGTLPYFATGGGDTVSITAQHMPALLQSNAEACVLLLGTNDYHRGHTPEETGANLASMCHTMEEHGIIPILCDTLPVRPGQEDKAAWLVRMRPVTAQVCQADPKIIHIDWFYVLDPDGDGTGDYGYYFDMLHPNPGGMSMLAEYAANILRPYVRPRDPFEDTVWLSPNPELNGTGDSPDGWVCQTSSYDFTTTLIPRADGHGNWWQISAVANPPDTFTQIRYDWGTSGVAPWAPGDTVEMIVEFETDPDVTIHWNLTPAMTLLPSSARTTDSRLTIASDAALSRVPKGVLRTPPMVIPAGNTGFWPLLSFSGSGTFRLGRMGIRKVPTTFATWINTFPLTDKSPNGDPDGDGIPNLLEWKLGGDPATPDAKSLLSFQPGAGGVQFGFKKPARSDADSSLYLQQSSDLLNWQEFPVGGAGSNGPFQDDSNSEIWKFNATGPKSFIRLRADWKN